MTTHYELRNSNTQILSPAYASALNSMHHTRKVPDGYVLLYQNSNYSNTTKQCAYLCEKHKVQWNGRVGGHNSPNRF